MILSSSHDRQPTFWTLNVLGVSAGDYPRCQRCLPTENTQNISDSRADSNASNKRRELHQIPFASARKTPFHPFGTPKVLSPHYVGQGMIRYDQDRALYIHRSIGISFVTSEISTSAPGKRWHRMTPMPGFPGIM